MNCKSTAGGSRSWRRGTASPCRQRPSRTWSGCASSACLSELVNLERDAWILVAAQMPEQMPTLMTVKSEQLNDPAVIALYRDLVEALDWPSGDRRLDALADRLVTLFEVGQDEWEEHAEDFPLPDELVELLDSVFLANAPFAPRLLALLEARGWRGWTRIERIKPL